MVGSPVGRRWATALRRVHGLANVYVCDAGALPGLGGVPPTLTIMANAVRIADALRARA